MVLWDYVIIRCGNLREEGMLFWESIFDEVVELGR